MPELYGVKKEWCQQNGGDFQRDTCEFDDLTVHFDGPGVTIETPEGTITSSAYAIPEKVTYDGSTRHRSDKKDGQPLVAYSISSGGFTLDPETMSIREHSGISQEEIRNSTPSELANKVPENAPAFALVKELFGLPDEIEFSEESRSQFKDKFGSEPLSAYSALMSGDYEKGAQNILYEAAAEEHQNNNYTPAENIRDSEDHIHPDDVTEEEIREMLKAKGFHVQRLRQIFGDSVPVWRGTSQNSITQRRDDGSVCVRSPVVSSNSIDPQVGEDYEGGLILERSVPTEDTWGSYLTTPFQHYDDEREVIVGHEPEECYKPDEYSKPRDGDKFNAIESVFRRYKE